jgi:glycerophosphoryl diester phosphodiesterase
VRLTGDGALVICHDPQLDRTTDGSGLISAQTLAQIRACDAGRRFAPSFTGERMPTLDEALSLTAELDLGADIEIKSDLGREYATAATVAATLERSRDHVPPLLVSSFLPAALAAMRTLAPQIPRGILFRLIPRGWSGLARRLGCVMIGANHRRLRPRRVTQIREAGYRLGAYTVNDPARARLLFGWGVTSVFSDVPDTLMKAGIGPGQSYGLTRFGAAAALGPGLIRQGAFR